MLVLLFGCVFVFCFVLPLFSVRNYFSKDCFQLLPVLIRRSSASHPSTISRHPSSTSRYPSSISRSSYSPLSISRSSCPSIELSTLFPRLTSTHFSPSPYLFTSIYHPPISTSLHQADLLYYCHFYILSSLVCTHLDPNLLYINDG